MEKLSFFSKDFGALALGRKILRENPTVSLELWVKKTSESSKENMLLEADFWEGAIREILSKKTKFGRVGIFFDRKNTTAREFCEKLVKTDFPYSPRDPRRAEKTPKILPFETQVLYEMANESLADTVEFRRLARKFIRRAKHAHIDTIFFAEAIFGVEKTCKILTKIAGKGIQTFFVTDFLPEELLKKSAKTRHITIFTGDDLVFTHQIAEKILRTKLKKTDVR